ncbi:hypothetical protein FCU94_18805 [Vibrio sp. JPW-9-11-11]|uniref:hypothetical protein n=1 Tax=Vibrio sp. JPW-9-11-11 TaxID=1416532 RepID=UPI00159322E0|nr:hypothetical protein [Vibrio sp. JPW-9-11-11]NVD08903.1 hypothetical protein [Vibrio sp. JPW-9-11-11]
MTELNHWLNKIGAEQLPTINYQPAVYQQFCQQHARLFERALQAKPEVAPQHHLLGVLTKAHIEATQQLSAHSDSAAAMHQALQSSLGEHSDKFTDQSTMQLMLVTHLWLYLQGYLKMDFSLANDHALSSATVINQVTQQDVQQLRTEFLASFYQGDSTSGARENLGLLARLRSWFSSKH